MTIKALFPTIEPTLNLDFANSKRLDPRVTFTRSSVGTYFDAAGVLRTAAVNEPRFDHDPSTGESLGLLVEESRANLLWPSQFPSFGTSAANNVWYENAAELDPTPNTAQAPDGTTTAALLAVNTSSAYKAVVLRTGSTATGTLAYSVYCKPASTDTKVRLFIAGEAGLNNYIGADFTLSGNGTASAATATGTATAPASPSITPAGNGWYRCTIYASLTGPTNITCLIYPGNTDAQTTASQTLVWGAQLEAGAFPTSYIPTTTTAVTRAADVASITGSNFSSWYNQSQGTVFTETIPRQFSQAFGVFSLDDGTTSERFQTRYSTTGAGALVASDGGTVQANFATLNTATTQTRSRLATSYAVNSFNACLDGGQIASGTSGTLPTPTQGVIGNAVGANYANAPISRIIFWPARLGNEVLQRLTQ